MKTDLTAVALWHASDEGERWAAGLRDRAVRDEMRRLAQEVARRAHVYEQHPEHDTDRYLDGFSSAMRVVEKIAMAVVNASGSVGLPVHTTDPDDADVPVTNPERDSWRRIVEEQRHEIHDLARQLEAAARRADFWQTMAESQEAGQ